MDHPRFAPLAVPLLTSAVLLACAAGAQAATPVPLGTTAGFALMAGSAITNTGSTTIVGDIGLCCTGIGYTGFGPGADQVTQSGALYVSPPAGPAATAQDDLDIAYANAAAQPAAVLGVDLSLSGTPAMPLTPGAYESPGNGALQINTGLVLDFQGDPNAVFVFHGTTLTTAANAAGSVVIVNGGATPSACNVFWQLSDTATSVSLGAGSAFSGTTMSLGASVLGAGATVNGRILTRRSKAVTMNTNTIVRSTCAAPAGSGTPSVGGSSGTPVDTTTPTTSGTETGETTTAVAGTTSAAGTIVAAAPSATVSAQQAAARKAARRVAERRRRVAAAAAVARRQRAAAKRRAERARVTPRPARRAFGVTG